MMIIIIIIIIIMFNKEYMININMKLKRVMINSIFMIIIIYNMYMNNNINTISDFI
jgi:hypothetical protein